MLELRKEREREKEREGEKERESKLKRVLHRCIETCKNKTIFPYFLFMFPRSLLTIQKKLLNKLDTKNYFLF